MMTVKIVYRTSTSAVNMLISLATVRRGKSALLVIHAAYAGVRFAPRPSVLEYVQRFLNGCLTCENPSLLLSQCHMSHYRSANRLRLYTEVFDCYASIRPSSNQCEAEFGLSRLRGLRPMDAGIRTFILSQTATT